MVFLQMPRNEVFMDDFEFSSNLLYENLRILKQSYPFIQTGSIG